MSKFSIPFQVFHLHPENWTSGLTNCSDTVKSVTMRKAFPHSSELQKHSWDRGDSITPVHTQGKGFREVRICPESGRIQQFQPKSWNSRHCAMLHWVLSFQLKGKDCSHPPIFPKWTGKAREKGALDISTPWNKECCDSQTNPALGLSRRLHGQPEHNTRHTTSASLPPNQPTYLQLWNRNPLTL